MRRPVASPATQRLRATTRGPSRRSTVTKREQQKMEYEREVGRHAVQIAKLIPLNERQTAMMLADDPHTLHLLYHSLVADGFIEVED